MRELYAVQRLAVERLKPFLLELHRQSVYLPGDMPQQLATLLGPFLNTSDVRPKGRLAHRSIAEKRAIVQEYDLAIASGSWGSGAAVTRKYGVPLLTIKRWRDQLASDSMPKDPDWLKRPDPFAEALSKLSLPSSSLWKTSGVK